ncbi:MAG: hypothetical protein AB7P20_10935 [Rhizobiaceae bacterium]
MDIELIEQCADDRLTPAVVEQFIEAVGAEPLSVKVTIDGKAVLLPKIENTIQAADIVATYFGKADVRFGITQVPAGVEPVTVAAIDETLFEPCKNLSIGTEIFAGIYDALGDDWSGDDDGRFGAAIAAYGSGNDRPAVKPTTKEVAKPSVT